MVVQGRSDHCSTNAQTSALMRTGLLGKAAMRLILVELQVLKPRKLLSVSVSAAFALGCSHLQCRPTEIANACIICIHLHLMVNNLVKHYSCSNKKGTHLVLSSLLFTATVL